MGRLQHCYCLTTIMYTVMGVLEQIVFDERIAWGILPLIGGNIGFWSTALTLEYVVKKVLAAEQSTPGKGWSRIAKTVQHSTVKTRGEALAIAHSRVSRKEQFYGA